MKGIDIIAIELENPFGDDPNDLPTFQMHHAMNRDLTLLVNPQTWTIPKLLPTAIVRYEDLDSKNKEDRLSLAQYYEQQEMHYLRSMTMKTRSFNAKHQTRLQWAKQSWPGR